MTSARAREPLAPSTLRTFGTLNLVLGLVAFLMAGFYTVVIVGMGQLTEHIPEEERAKPEFASLESMANSRLWLYMLIGALASLAFACSGVLVRRLDRRGPKLARVAIAAALVAFLGYMIESFALVGTWLPPGEEVPDAFLYGILVLSGLSGGAMVFTYPAIFLWFLRRPFPAPETPRD